MDLSNFVYDIYEEIKLIEKNTTMSDKEKREQVLKMLESVEKTNYVMKMKTETIGLYLKNLRNDKDKFDNNLTNIEQDIENTKRKTKMISQSLKEVKDIEDKIDKEYLDKEKVAVEQMDKIKQKIVTEYKYDPEELEQLKKKNEELKERIQGIIDRLKAKEEEYQANMQTLEKNVNESSKEAEEKFSEYSSMAKELQTVMAKKQYLKIKTETMLQRLKIFRLKVPEFKEVIALKERQYAKYKTDIKDIVNKGYDNYLEKQKIEETVKKMNVLFMDLLQENEELNEELAKSQTETEKIKQKCKDLQQRLVKKN